MLRDYQKNQLEFIRKKLPGKLPLGIESPTGSGKTFVVLTYIKEYFQENPEEDILFVITTGFNRLVYQFAREAEKFEMRPIKLLGRNLVTCKKKTQESEVFIENNVYTAQAKCWERCEEVCMFEKVKKQIQDIGPRLVITNHSCYLLWLNLGLLKPNIVFVDEAHTFSQFYESYMTTEISKEEIEYVKSRLEVRDPVFHLFKRAIENGNQISMRLFEQIKNKLESEQELVQKLKNFATTKPSIDTYIETSPTGLKIVKFYHIFEVNQNLIRYVILSATIDNFTQTMFRLSRARVYREKQKIIDYRQSKLLVIPKEDFSEGVHIFLEKMNELGLKKGLVLSTTLKNIDIMLNNTYKYKVYQTQDFNDFLESTEPSVLAASRVMFQGIDIPNLDFVVLNSLPFPRYDEQFKAQSLYLEKIARMNPWTMFTLPKLKNDLVQTFGRLWRKPGDFGIIGILDSRIVKKFKYMIKYIEQSRPGIEVEYGDTE